MSNPTGDALAAYEKGKGELLPCPFCGGKPYESRQGVICCDDCGACPVFKPDVMENKAAWNTRQHSEPVAVEQGVWESFCDAGYFHQWAVRPVGENRWGHCFHVPSRQEAEGLRDLLNGFTTQATGRDEGVAGVMKRECYAILFDEPGCEPEYYVGTGARQGAAHRFDELSGHRHAHLFKRIVDNTKPGWQDALVAIQQGGSHE